MIERVYGRHPVVEALRAGAGVQKVWIAKGVQRAPVLDEIRRLAAAATVEVSEAPRDELDSLAGGASHQGVVAETAPYAYGSFEDLIEGRPRLVLMDGVTDPHNVGAVLRSAAGFGFTGVLLPRRRSAAVTATVRRVSAGAAERIIVARVGSAASTVDRLSKEGVETIGLAAGASTPYDSNVFPSGALCLVLGAEGRGLAPLTARRCDQVVSIPLAEGIESLNLAAAAAVVMAEVARSDRRRDGSAPPIDGATSL